MEAARAELDVHVPPGFQNIVVKEAYGEHVGGENDAARKRARLAVAKEMAREKGRPSELINEALRGRIILCSSV